MSETLQNTEPWIAKAVFEAVTFDPQTISKKLNRETHLAQVIQPPQIIDNQDDGNDPKLCHLVISDGLNSISVYVKIQPRTLNIVSGALVRIPFKHWSISYISLMGSSNNGLCKRGPFCLILYETELQFDTEHTRGDDQAVTRYNSRCRPCIETIACEGMGIIGPPINVHSAIDIRRALKAIPSNAQRLRQIVDCFNYSLQNDNPNEVHKNFIPGPDLVVLACLDKYPESSIVHALVRVNRIFTRNRMMRPDSPRQESDETPAFNRIGSTPMTVHRSDDVSGLMSPGTPLGYQTVSEAQSPHPIQGISAMLNDGSSGDDNAEYCDDQFEENLKANGDGADGGGETNVVESESQEIPEAPRKNKRNGNLQNIENEDREEAQSLENNHAVESASFESVDFGSEDDSPPLNTQAPQNLNISNKESTNEDREEAQSLENNHAVENTIESEPISSENDSPPLNTQASQNLNISNIESTNEDQEEAQSLENNHAVENTIESEPISSENDSPPLNTQASQNLNISNIESTNEDQEEAQSLENNHAVENTIESEPISSENDSPPLNTQASQNLNISNIESTNEDREEAQSLENNHAAEKAYEPIGSEDDSPPLDTQASQNLSISNMEITNKDREETQFIENNHAYEPIGSENDSPPLETQSPQKLSISNTEISEDAIQCRETRKPIKKTSTTSPLESKPANEGETQPLGTQSARESPSNTNLNNDGSLEELNGGHLKIDERPSIKLSNKNKSARDSENEVSLDDNTSTTIPSTIVVRPVEENLIEMQRTIPNPAQFQKTSEAKHDLEGGNLVSEENSRGAIETLKKANLANLQLTSKGRAEDKEKHASIASQKKTTLKPRGRSFRLTDLVRKRKPSETNGKDDGKIVKKKKVVKKKTDKKSSVFEILDWMNE